MLWLNFVLGMPFSLRQRRLAKARPSMSKQEFIDRTASSTIGKSAASMVWQKLRDAAIIDAFTPYPDDDLLNIYGLADEDLDEDIILDTLKALKRAIPGESFLKSMGPIKCPADIVRLVESQPDTAKRD
jgi:hypothetical protein